MYLGARHKEVGGRGHKDTNRQDASQLRSSLMSQSFGSPSVTSLLLWRPSDALKNRCLCFILSCRCCGQEQSFVCLGGHTVGNSGSRGVMLIALVWDVLVFLLVLFVFINSPVFLLIFPALIVPSHLFWV